MLLDQLVANADPLTEKQLAQGLAALEEAIAVPAVTASFRPGVLIAVMGLRRGIGAHAFEVERPGGLFGELAVVAPGLSSRVRLLKRDHVRLTKTADSLIAEVMRLPAEALRVRSMELMRDVLLHRQRSSDVAHAVQSREESPVDPPEIHRI